MNSPFSGLSPISSKKFRTPPSQVTQFLEDPTPRPPPLLKGGGGSNYDISVYVKAYPIFSQTNKITK